MPLSPSNVKFKQSPLLQSFMTLTRKVEESLGAAYGQSKNLDVEESLWGATSEENLYEVAKPGYSIEPNQ
jgi:hypothetical protein